MLHPTVTSVMIARWSRLSKVVGRTLEGHWKDVGRETEGCEKYECTIRKIRQMTKKLKKHIKIAQNLHISFFFCNFARFLK